MLEKLNVKRWLAVGVAIIILGLSALSSNLSTMINQEERLAKVESLFKKSFDPSAINEQVIQDGDPKKRIAVLRVNGVIANSQASAFAPGAYNHQALLSSFEKIKEDPSIKGVVLCVNSPGGGVYESAEIYRQIQALKEEYKLPIWTSMGNMAASGGYYISAPTDKIYATPETITGSIGVIMGGQNLSGLMEKLGIQDQVIKSGAHKDIGSPTRPMTPEDQAILQGLVDNMYGRFVNIVAQGRHMDQAKVRTLADGRIYDGIQAQSAGLVDQLGYFDDLLKDFSKELKLQSPEVFEYKPNDLGSFSSFFGSFNRSKDLTLLSQILTAHAYDSGPRPMYLYGGE